MSPAQMDFFGGDEFNEEEEAKKADKAGENF